MICLLDILKVDLEEREEPQDTNTADRGEQIEDYFKILYINLPCLSSWTLCTCIIILAN